MKTKNIYFVLSLIALSTSILCLMTGIDGSTDLAHTSLLLLIIMNQQPK